MLFKDISIIDENFKVLKNMNVLIEQDRIKYIGKDAPKDYVGEIYNGQNKLLLSGFVNAHCHVPMTLLRGYGENLPLDKWLFDCVFPFENKIKEKDMFNGSMLGIAEMIKFGTTSFTDMYFICDEIAKAVSQTGIKANIGKGVTCFDDSDFLNLETYQQSKQLYSQWNNTCDGRVLIDMTIHAEYTSTPKVVKGLANYAKNLGANIQMHLSETEKEHNECIEKYGKTPTEYMLDCGIFENPTIVAHCVAVTENDIDILKQNNVSVAHCPVSNLKLGSGIAPISKMVEKGLNVCIGTDGAASNNNLNLLEEIKLASILQKGFYQNPLLISPEQVIKMATLNGAKSQGRKDTGLLKEGYKADLIVIDMGKPHLTPNYNDLYNLVYAGLGSDVEITMVNGKVLYKQGEYKTLDIEKVKFEANNSVKQILNSL